MKKSVILIVLYLLIGQSGLYSNENQIKNTPLTLDDCISIAIQQNPSILSSQQLFQASKARISQALAFSNPTLNYDSDLQSKIFRFKDSGESYLGVSQNFEFPGKRSLRGKIAQKDSEEILAEIQQLKLDLIYQVKLAFFELLLAQEKSKYFDQNFELSKDFYEKVKIKYDAGEVAKVEVLRASVETSKASNQVQRTQSEINLAKAKLNFLLARKKFKPIEIQGDLKNKRKTFNLEELVARALSNRPEIQQLFVAQDRERLIKKQGVMSYFPDFELGVSQHRLKGEGNFYDFTISFPIPLFFWQPKKGKIAEAEANLRSLDKRSEQIRNEITLEIQEAYTNVLTADSQIQLFQDEILDQAEEVYNMFFINYQEGELGAIELIEARRTLIESNLSYADALYNYDAGLAALEKALGQTEE